ncbi:plasmalemma vesicle-associated protein [Discoglossus pictus]
MDNSYLMAKFGLESKDLLRSNKKGCCYYLRYFFLFTSIIQFLIILGLVLFMVYGNAHASTEHRLKNVENYNQKLLGNIQELKDNLKAEGGKLNICYGRYHMKQEELYTMNQSLQAMSADIQKQSMIIMHLQSSGRTCKCSIDAFNHLNTSLYAVRTKQISLETGYKNYMDNCTNNMDLLKSQVHQANYVRDECQIEIADCREKGFTMQAQMDAFKTSCTSVEEKFKTLLQNFKENFDTTIGKYVPATEMKSNQICKFLNDDAKKIIESYLSRLGQEISSKQQENSQLQVGKNRSDNALEECGQEKARILEKNKSDQDSMQRNCDAKLKDAYKANNELRKEINYMAKLRQSTLTIPDKDREQGVRETSLPKIFGVSV